MAENKKSFIGYTEWGETFEMLEDAEAGKLIKHFFKYITDQGPVLEDKLLQIAFNPIKQHLKRDLVKWSATKDRKSEGGKKGMEARWGKKDITNDNIVINPITPITVNDNVNVNVNEKEKITFFKIEECLQISLRDPRWVKANNTSELELKAFNKVLEKRGIYETNPAEYKSHFANWKPKGKNEIQTEQPSTPVKHISEITAKYDNYWKPEKKESNGV